MDKYARVLTCVLLTVSVTVRTIQGDDYYREYSMEKQCGREVSMILQSVYQLEMSLDHGRPNCTVEIEGWYSYPKLMFYFEDLDLYCDDGYLEFYDGEVLDFFDKFHGNKRVEGLASQVCGRKPSGVYTTEEMKLSIRYVSKTGRNAPSDAMKIIVTSYDDGYCEDYNYKCSNGRCISDRIRCTGHNSCGDGSDCRLEVGVIVGIVLGSLFGLAVIVSVIIAVVCCQRSNRRQRAMQSPGQVLYTVNNGQSQVQYPPPQTYPGYTQPPYGQPQGGVTQTQTTGYNVTTQ